MFLLIFGFCCGVYVGVKYSAKLKLKLPHLPPYYRIVRLGDRYAVRGGWFAVTGFCYVDRESGYKWPDFSYARDYASVKTLDEAKAILERSRNQVVEIVDE